MFLAPATLKPANQGTMPSYSIQMNVPRGGVSPGMASTASALPNRDGRWPWARPEARGMAAAPNGHPRNRPQIPRRSKSDTGFPWGREGPDLPDLSGGLPGTRAHTAPIGEATPGPFYDLERAGGKYRSVARQVEFMPERYALLREESEKRFNGEGGESYGLYMSTPKNLGPGQHMIHPQWVDPNIEEQKTPKGFVQGSSKVGGAWGRDTQLRIPEGKNSWLMLNGLISSEPENELLQVDERLRKWKPNGQHKGSLVMKARREMAPWSHVSSPF